MFLFLFFDDDVIPGMSLMCLFVCLLSRLVTNYRTFYMYASSEVEAIEWLQILDWRLKQVITCVDARSHMTIPCFIVGKVSFAGT